MCAQNARISVRPDEDINKALNRFKKKCEKAGIGRDIKRNQYYEKPSQRRRRELLKRIKALARLERKEDRKRRKLVKRAGIRR